ncbi:MAG: sugar ABC transporter permease, partial [Oscillospiraceae bacterium]
MKSHRLTKRDVKEYAQGTLFVLPFLILFSIFVVVPVGVSIVISLTDYDMLQVPNFVGFDIYRSLLLDDDFFLLSIK